jgi:hypothetical protein
MGRTPSLFRRLLKLGPRDLATDQQIGEAAVLEMLTGKNAFAERIINSLMSLEDWPDLGDGTPNQTERTTLNLWGFALAVRHSFPATSDDEKTEFLEQVHNWILDNEVRGAARPEQVQEIQKLVDLMLVRYPEYNIAFDEVQRRRAASEKFAEDPLVQIIVKNLFGHETDSVIVWVKVALTFGIYLPLFADSFRGRWESIRTIVQRALSGGTRAETRAKLRNA